jgi:hypothetical protein
MEPTAAPPEQKPLEVEDGGKAEKKGTGRKRLGKADMEKRRPRKRALVYLPERDGEVEIQELRPGDMNEITDKCMIRKPHSDPKLAALGMKESDYDGKKRAAYIIAKGLLDENGKPMYYGDDYIYGAEKILGEFSNAEQDLLYREIARVSGIDKEGRELAGKGSEQTPSGEPSAPSPSTT